MVTSPRFVLTQASSNSLVLNPLVPVWPSTRRPRLGIGRSRWSTTRICLHDLGSERGSSMRALARRRAVGSWIEARQMPCRLNTMLSANSSLQSSQSDGDAVRPVSLDLEGRAHFDDANVVRAGLPAALTLAVHGQVRSAIPGQGPFEQDKHDWRASSATPGNAHRRYARIPEVVAEQMSQAEIVPPNLVRHLCCCSAVSKALTRRCALASRLASAPGRSPSRGSVASRSAATGSRGGGKRLGRGAIMSTTPRPGLKIVNDANERLVGRGRGRRERGERIAF